MFGHQRRVGANAWAALRRAIAFENAHPEFAHPGGGRGLLHLLRSRKEIAQEAKVVWMRLARVTVQEGVGSKKHRAIKIVKGRRHNPIMKRRGINEHVSAANQRQE